MNCPLTCAPIFLLLNYKESSCDEVKEQEALSSGGNANFYGYYGKQFRDYSPIKLSTMI